jgi:hypothetical protein
MRSNALTRWKRVPASIPPGESPLWLTGWFRRSHRAHLREVREARRYHPGHTVREEEVPAAAARRRRVGRCETDGWRGIPFTMSSRSDSARSCLTICAFSPFPNLLGLPARAFTMIANSTRAIATPTNTIVVIDAPLSMGAQNQFFRRDCAPGGVLADRLRRLLS